MTVALSKKCHLGFSLEMEPSGRVVGQPLMAARGRCFFYDSELEKLTVVSEEPRSA